MFSDYTNVKAIHVVKAVTNPSFANGLNSRDDKDRVYNNISPIHAVALLKQVRLCAADAVLHANRAKDADTDKGKIITRNAHDMQQLVKAVTICIQWNGEPGPVIGEKPVNRLQYEFTKLIKPKNALSQYARPSIEYEEFVQNKNYEIEEMNAERSRYRQPLLPYHDVDKPTEELIKEYKEEVKFEPAAPDSARTNNGNDLIAAGSQIIRPIGSDAEWNEMITGDGFFGSNTNIMGHINSDHMTLEEENRFRVAGQQLMLAINKTNFASQYNVADSNRENNFINHFVESYLANAYPNKDTWDTMVSNIVKSLSEIKDLKDRYAVLIEYLPYLPKSSDGKTLNYVQIVQSIKAAYKDLLGTDSTQNWHNFRTLISQADYMLKSRADRSQIPNQIRLILEEVSKMTVNHINDRKNNKRTRDGLNKSKPGDVNVNKTGIVVASGSGLNNSGNGQSKKSKNKKQQVPQHCWCCCADQTYTLENGHHVTKCPKYDTKPVDATKKDWIATSKADSSKTMVRSEQAKTIADYRNNNNLNDKPIPKKSQ